jgi:CDP-diacylglycerol pyrophosphatase
MRRHVAALAAAIAVAGCAASRDHPGTGPSALWTIVSRCVDRQTAAYCSCPPFELSCCGNPSTPDADVVWARTPDFVVIRDLRMCGCPPGFVSGLAMPVTRVSGIEDPRRPEGIWPFAWEAARARIPDEQAIGLVLNPPDARTQNQMHVHLLRLRAEVRPWLDGDAPAPPGVQVIPVQDLDAVFAAVQARVGADHMRDTGVLVARGRRGGWRAVLTDRTSPQAFTLNRCAAQ